MSDTSASNPTLTIAQPAALADLVRASGASRQALVDYGVAHEGLGNPPPARHQRFRQAGALLEHHERDFTVRVAAGMELGALQASLMARGQFLPVDADDDLTVGEVINHHVYGPLRASYGSVRDLMLGLHYVDGLGRDIHVGGRTVKNVAGYDVSRFLVGGLGEFGIVHEATLRTYAVPPQVLVVRLGLADPRAIDRHLPAWMLSDAAPGSIAIVRQDGAWLLEIAYLGTQRAGQTQARCLQRLVQSEPGLRGSDPAAEDLATWRAATAAARSWRRRCTALVKLVVPPASTGSVCIELGSWSDGTAPLCIDALPAHGCIFAGSDLDGPQVAGLDRVLGAVLGGIGGLRVWHRRPDGARSVAPFAPPQSDWAMLGQLKQTMDPRRILNPGRFLAVAEAQS